MSAGNTYNCSPEDTSYINTIMLIETFIFNSDHGMLQIQRNLIDGHRHTVRIRRCQFLKLIPVGKSAWYAGIKEGRFPAPVKLNKRASAYRVEDIRALIERLSSGEAA